MRITFITPPDNLSGGNRVIAIYAERLQALGHQVSIVLPPRRVAPRRERLRQAFRLLKRGQVRGALRRLRLGDSTPRVPGFLEQSACKLTVLETYRPIRDADVPDADVVVATWWETAHWVAGLDSSKGTKAFFMQDYGAPGQELEKITPTWSLGFHVVTIARWLKELIKTHAPTATVDVVENAVDLELFQQPPRSMPIRPTIGFVYRESAVKGYDTALEAYRMARKEIPDLRCVTLGSKPRRQLAHLPSDVEYWANPGDRQLAALYGCCTVWLFASRLEGYGLPISEAMACRTPVIATRAGAAPELLESGGGWLIATDDSQAMASAIIEACGLSPAKWAKMSEAAHARVRDYTWVHAGNAFAAALERAAAQ